MHTIIPREFPPECIPGCFQLSYSTLGTQKGNAPQLLGAWMDPLTSQPLVQGAHHGSQHETNKGPSHPLCQRRVEHQEVFSAATLALQWGPPKDWPRAALWLFSQSLKKERLPPLPPGGVMGTRGGGGCGGGPLRPPLLIQQTFWPRTVWVLGLSAQCPILQGQVVFGERVSRKGRQLAEGDHHVCPCVLPWQPGHVWLWP